MSIFIFPAHLFSSYHLKALIILYIDGDPDGLKYSRITGRVNMGYKTFGYTVGPSIVMGRLLIDLVNCSLLSELLNLWVSLLRFIDQTGPVKKKNRQSDNLVIF